MRTLQYGDMRRGVFKPCLAKVRASMKMENLPYIRFQHTPEYCAVNDQLVLHLRQTWAQVLTEHRETLATDRRLRANAANATLH